MTNYASVSDAKTFARLISYKDLGFSSEDDYTDHVNDLLKACSRRIDRYCHRPDNFFAGPHDSGGTGITITEYHDGKLTRKSHRYQLTERVDAHDIYRQTYWIEHTPIIAITSVKENIASIGSSDSWTTITDYRLSNDTGRLVFKAGAEPDEGVKNVQIIYTAGYLIDAIPDEIREATGMLAGNYLQARAQEYTTQHIQWGRPTTLDIKRPEIFTQDIKDLLEPYVKKRSLE